VIFVPVAGVSCAATAPALLQSSGKGCLSEGGRQGCTPGRALSSASWITITPDGRNVYVGAEASGAINIYQRVGPFGGLIQPDGSAGCLSESALEGCGSARALTGARPVAVSPDGRSVYVGALNGVAVFLRDRGSGALVQLPGPAGCVENGAAEGCGAARGFAKGSVRGLAVSADGRFVYAAVRFTSVVAVFARDPNSGAISQLPGGAGCISETRRPGCAWGRGLHGSRDVVLSPDQRFVYIASEDGNSVAVFARNRRTGTLIQLRGRSGCLQQRGNDGCTPVRAFLSPHQLALSRNGLDAYVASDHSAAVDVLRRDPGNGTLHQLAGRAGCVEDGGGEGCTPGSALGAAHSIAVAPSGLVYVAGNSANSVAIFAVDSRTAGLRERGCIASRGPPECARAFGLMGVHSITLSSDGRTLYAASERGDAIVVLTVG